MSLTIWADKVNDGKELKERKKEKHFSSQTTEPTTDRIRVMTYNVLADCYATTEQYMYCPSWALEWNFRKNAILNELLASDCDIICLQEVEAGQFDKFFRPQLANNGYGGIFTIKSRARTYDDPSTVDGCATFFKNSRHVWSLLQLHSSSTDTIVLLVQISSS
jgi:mRNA deadenylase 3'-5' endonuclease subunit Ccr4